MSDIFRWIVFPLLITAICFIVGVFIARMDINKYFKEVNCTCVEPITPTDKSNGHCTIKLLINRLDGSTKWLDTKEKCR